ncbi:hypothetical protein ABT160_45180 [Streptomyces sp. NPDC001941]|uniref:hypothetical protein n=1 Tax=Streptomyces sp. NPDC001941 TaxID=3154659 RepID=UPI0033201585
MTPLPNPEVQSSADFRDLLLLLVGHFQRPGTPTPQIDDVLLRWEGTLPERAPQPGWSGLAAQLLTALAAPPAGPAEPAPLSREQEPSGPLELQAFLRALAADYARSRAWTEDRVARGLWAGDGGGWASGSLPQYLESWHAWLDTWLDERRDPRDVPPIEPVSWESVALQLEAASAYE